MKKHIFITTIFALLLTCCLTAAGAATASEKDEFTTSMIDPGGDRLLGLWQSEAGDRKIEIYRQGDRYFGKVLYDAKNKVQPGTVVLKDMVYQRNVWKGKVFVPSRGRMYNVQLNLKDATKLEMIASAGFISQKRFFFRVN